MAIYGIVVASAVLIRVLCQRIQIEKERADRATITFFFAAYLMLLCLRDKYVGSDTIGYLMSFETLNRMSLKGAIAFFGKEPGFIILVKLIGAIGGERLFITVVACLSVLPVIKFYREESEGAILCIAFFLISLLFEMFFSGMRQSIAIGLAVPAYYLTKKRRWISFILIVLLAFLFHHSGIMIALIYPIYHAKITRKWLWGVLPLFVFVYLRRDLIFNYVINFAGEDYISGYSYLTGQSSQTALMILFILLSIYSYVMLDERIAGEEEIGLRNILLLATFVHMFTPLHPTVSRLNYYYILFIPVAITRINTRCNRRFYQIAKVAEGVMSAYFIFYFFAFKGDSLNTANYQFFF